MIIMGIEEAVLASVMIDPTAMAEAAAVGLRPHHFVSMQNRIVWNALREMSEDGLKIDMISLIGYMEAKNTIER